MKGASGNQTGFTEILNSVFSLFVFFIMGKGSDAGWEASSCLVLIARFLYKIEIINCVKKTKSSCAGCTACVCARRSACRAGAIPPCGCGHCCLQRADGKLPHLCTGMYPYQSGCFLITRGWPLTAGPGFALHRLCLDKP